MNQRIDELFEQALDEAVPETWSSLNPQQLSKLKTVFAQLVIKEMSNQEPVAWMWGYRSVTTGEMDWRGYVEIAAHPNLRSPAIIMEPLYTHPPQRKPLTKESLLYIYNQLPNWGMDMDRLPQGLEKFARGIEAAHGIKGKHDKG